MRVSVITVCYNAAATIEDALASVAAQTHDDVEHIIVDGASTDNTLEIVKRFPHVARAVSEPDHGLYDAMNKGARLATGELIGWLNADDMLADPHALSAIVESARASRADIVAASVNIVRSDDVTRIIRHYSSAGFVPRLLRYGFAPPHPGLYLRRLAAQAVGDYDPTYRIAADFDFIVRAFQCDLTYVCLPRVVVTMRTGGTSSGLSASFQSFRESYLSLKKNNARTNIVMMSMKYFMKALQFIRRSAGVTHHLRPIAQKQER